MLAKRPSVDAMSPKYGFTMRLPIRKQGYGSRGFFILRDHYEPFFEILDQIVKPGGTFIDCGANQGVYTLAASMLVGKTGHVVAIDPQPYAVKCIKQNLDLNGLDNVTIIEAAVSDKKGVATLDFSQSEVSASIINNYGGSRTHDVETNRLDDIVESRNLTPAIIKLDVEGAELMALHGAANLIAQHKPLFAIEVYHPGDEEIIQALEYLQSRGYSAYIIRNGKLLRTKKVITHEANAILIHSDRTNEFQKLMAS